MSGETENNVSGWTVDTLHSLFTRITNEIEKRFEQRLIEVDKRYEQRFLAQQTAVTAALTSAKEAVTAALTAADRAVAKSEASAEIRFQSVNEFRGQLSDQAATLLSRSEAEARLAALSDKIDVNAVGLTKLELMLREEIGLSVHRSDIVILTDAITKLRDNQTLGSGRSTAFSNVVSTGLALLAVMVSVGIALFSRH